jgi:CHAT domain
VVINGRDDAKRILAVSATTPASNEYEFLDTDMAFKEIKHEIRASEYRDYLEWHSLRAATREGLIKGTDEIKPHILYFSGHGEEGELVLRDAHGRPEKLKHSDLARILAGPGGRNLEILFLSACFSAVRLDQLGFGRAGTIVGMRRDIPELYARKFAIAFFFALGNGDSIDEAFAQGKLMLEESAPGKEKIPKLIPLDDPERAKPYLPIAHHGGGVTLEEVRIRPPETMKPVDGYRYYLLEVGPGREQPPTDQIRNRRVSFEPEGDDLVARVHQTVTGLQFKCYVVVPEEAPEPGELTAAMADARWEDPSQDRRYPNRIWFLLADQERARTIEGYINNYLPWDVPA